jgi:hypothetical protein
VYAGSLLIYRGSLSWSLAGKLSLKVPPGLSVKGLPVSGEVAVSLGHGGADAIVHAAVGGTFKVSGSVDLHLTLDEGLILKGLELELDSDLPVKSLLVKKAKLAYRSTAAGDIWEGAVAVQLPANGPTINGAVTVTDGSLSELSLESGDLNEPFGEVVFLQSLGLKVLVSPHLEATGSIGLSAGPEIEGKTVAALKGSLTAKIGEPFVLEAAGTLSLADQQLASAHVTVAPGLVKFDGEASASIASVKVRGAIRGFITTERFQAAGLVSLEFEGASARGDGLVNNTGLAGCGEVSVLGHGISVGGVHLWSGQNRLFYDSCGFSRLERALAARAAAATPGTRTIMVPPNTKQLNLIVTGTNGAPDAVLHEADADASVTPESQGRFGAGAYLAAGNASANQTSIAIADPPVGALEVSPAAGQPPFVELGSATPLPDPNVKVRLHPVRAGRYSLTWRARRVPGQTLTFIDGNAAGQQTIRTTSASRGKVVFRALRDGVGPQKLAVTVEQDGVIREIRPVTSFSPTPLRLGLPRLMVHRRGQRLEIVWKRAVNATGYQLTLNTSDGRSLYFSTKANVHAIEIPSARHLTVRVRATGPGETIGHSYTARL